MGFAGETFYGTRIASKINTLHDFWMETKAMTEYFTFKRAFAETKKTFWKGKTSKFGLFLGYFLAALQVYNLGESIFTTPDFNNSPWKLY